MHTLYKMITASIKLSNQNSLELPYTIIIIIIRVVQRRGALPVVQPTDLLSSHESLSPSSLTDSSHPAASVSDIHTHLPPWSAGWKQAPPPPASAVAVFAAEAVSTEKIVSLLA